MISRRQAGQRAVLATALVLAAAVAVVTPAAPVVADGNEAPGAPGIYESITAGADHTCVRVASGRLRCWGGNGQGQLGHGNDEDLGDEPDEMRSELMAVPLGAGRAVKSVAAGASAATCAVLQDGTLKCWGTWQRNGHPGGNDLGDAPGEMGDDLPDVYLGAGQTAHTVSVGLHATCAITGAGAVKCWGRGYGGELGTGNSGEYFTPTGPVALGAGRTATTISSGGFHTCTLLDDLSLKCWGMGSFGQLGITIPGSNANAGDSSGEMGDNLPPVDLGTGRTATALGMGYQHSCVLLDDATVKCWGRNTDGQLGLGDTDNRGDDPVAEMGDHLPTVDLGTGRTATAITAGAAHTCALLDNGQVKCWGGNQYGQLGLGDTDPRGDGQDEMGDDLPAVDLGTGRTALAITSGDQHTCAVLDDNTFKCWGRNNHGQLGQGDTEDRGDEPGEMGDDLPTIPVAASGIEGTVATPQATPLEEVLVAVLRASDFSLVAAVPDVDGYFTRDLPAGDYYLYVFERTGAYTSGFHGPPTLVQVAAGQPTFVEVAPPATRGSLSGSVTDAVSDAPVAGAWVAALTTTNGTFEIGTTTDASGQFTIEGLRPGTHLAVYLDPTGAHPARFHPNLPDPTGATHLVVTAGGVTDASAAVDPQPTPGTGSALTGTVTETGTGAALAGIQVVALRASDFTFTRGATTNAAGNYTLNVPAGVSYRVGFVDPTGAHTVEWFDDQAAQNVGAATEVAVPGTANAVLTRATGTVTGTVTNGAAAPVAGVWAIAIGANGIAGGAITAADGSYTITGLAPGLAPGTYRVAFIDPATTTVEFWLDAPDYDTASSFAVPAGGTTVIDATVGP